MNKITKALLSALLAAGITAPGVMACNDKVVTLGDSNTQGANWKDNNYDNSKKWTVKLDESKWVVNAGIAGNTSGMGVDRMRSVLNHHPETVTIMFGTNDGVIRANGAPRTSLVNFERDLNYMVNALQAKGINVVLMTAVPVIEEGKGYYYSRHSKKLYSKYGGARKFQDSYNNITRKVARQQGVELVDTYRIFLRYAGGSTDSALVKSNLMDPSGTHMSEYGASVLYRSVNNTLVREGY